MECLVGMILEKMEKDERKIGEKIVGKCVWLEEVILRGRIGPLFVKGEFSPQIWEKVGLR